MTAEKTLSRESTSESGKINPLIHAIIMIFIVLGFSVFIPPITAFAETTGAKYPGTAATTYISNSPIWLSTPSILKEDENWAYVTINGNQSNYLKGTNYDFTNIPEGAAIDTITLNIKRYGTYILDKEVCLIDKSGNLKISTNKADTTSEWGNTFQIASYIWSSSDLSNAGLTLDDIKSPNFGAALKVSANGTNKNARVDYMQMTITYTDKTTPRILSVTGNPESWQNTDVTLTVNATDINSGIAEAGGYSFDNGTTWQDSNQKVFDSNQTVNIKVKNAEGSISDAQSIEINRIDKEKPVFTISGMISPSQGNTVTLTVNATDISSGIAAKGGYSFDNGITWQDNNQKTFDSNQSVNIKVKDAAGNITDAIQILNYPNFISNQSNYKITVINGTGSNTYNAFSNATIKATVPSGKVFAGWRDKTPDPLTGSPTDSIISYNPNYTFVITSNKILEATFSDTVTPVPAISLDSSTIKLNVNDIYGKIHFISTIAVPTGYNLVECGVVMSKNVNRDLTKENALTTLRSTAQNSAGQFYSIFNVAYGNTLYVRSYIKYKNAEGIEEIRYSENIVAATMTKQ
jgi:hypothetical protein